MNNYSVKIAANLLILVVCAVAIYFLHPILVPLLMAFLIAILLRPVVIFFNTKLKFPHVLAVLITVILAMLVGAGVVFFISKEISGFSQDLPNIKQHLNTHYHNIQIWVNEKFDVSYHKQDNYIQKVTQETFQSGNDLMGSTLDTFSSVVLTVILVPIYTFLILLYRTLFIKFFTKIVNQEHHLIMQEIMFEIKTVVRSYIVGLLLEMGIIATLISVSLMIIGVDYALLIGVITCILNLIPYIGMLTSALLSMAIALGGSTELSTLISVAIVFVVVHLLDGNILVPRVVSSKVKINALASMLGIISAGSLVGISGMFLALPVLAITKVVFDRIPALEPWGYLLGDTMPKKIEWYNAILSDESIENIPTPSETINPQEPNKQDN